MPAATLGCQDIFDHGLINAYGLRTEVQAVIGGRESEESAGAFVGLWKLVGDFIEIANRFAVHPVLEFQHAGQVVRIVEVNAVGIIFFEKLTLLLNHRQLIAPKSFH